MYKDEIRQRGSTYNKQDLEHVRQRVAEALRRNKTQEAITRVVAFLGILMLITGVIWVLTEVDFKVKEKGKYEDKSALFNTVMHEQSDGLKLKVDYFIHGSKAAETKFKDGLKHQNSESYYQTGEQFRSALYYYDTLIVDIYFYKSGDTIKNFPVITDDQIHHVTFFNEKSAKKIELDFYDGKIIKDSYKETLKD